MRRRRRTRRRSRSIEPKVELLYKSPDRYPNALEAAPDGLWVGDQVSERINKLDWETGKVLEDFIGEAHNTSGLAVGGGYIWVGCNGAGTAASLREFKRPFDKNYGEIVAARHEGKAGQGLPDSVGRRSRHVVPQDTGKLWAVAPGPRVSRRDGPEGRPANLCGWSPITHERAARPRLVRRLPSG